MLNINKIKGRMRELGKTQSDVAKELGLNSSTFNRKINRKDGHYLSIKEAYSLIEYLEIPLEDISFYFFINSLT